MRGVTVAVLAGAGVVVLSAIFYLRGGDPGSENVPPPAVSAVRPRPQPPPKMKERSARVEERLGEIREDFAHRQLGAVNPPPNKREMPTMAARNRTPVQDEEHTDFGDEDPQEMEELKHTLLTDPDPEERIGAVLMLTGEEGPESLRMLLEAMDDPDPEVRLAVVEALGDRAEDLSPDTLTIALQDPDAEVRFEAVSILGDMETPEALEMVRIALGDKDDDVRALAEGILDFADEDDDDLEELTPGTSRQQKQNQAAAQR